MFLTLLQSQAPAVISLGTGTFTLSGQAITMTPSVLPKLVLGTGMFYLHGVDLTMFVTTEDQTRVKVGSTFRTRRRGV